MRRKGRVAARTSRFTLSINSIVFPSLSAARYMYLHRFPILIYVSSARHEIPLILNVGGFVPSPIQGCEMLCFRLGLMVKDGTCFLL
jgi:hypothetical protein